ncbi:MULTISPECIES: hypothetical protein [Bacillaceae]|uniref:Putative secreted protein n=3 Tax=Bacillales TaxID=1385 RepID=A0A090IZS6_9BACI|nr:hypothetical protein [Caldibacillus thermoamylovorans]CEE03262.1 putative secreted protein [Caldibacillus thermoamylovorans]
MLIKLGKKATFLLMAVSILSLMGCGSLNKIQAKQIEEKLSEMYGGTFEVLALGNRFGTRTNDYVKAYVKEVDSGVVFSAKMNTKGEIIADGYAIRKVSRQLEELLNKNLESEGISGSSMMQGIVSTDTGEIEVGMSLDDYIAKHKPDSFGGYLVVKESPNNTGAAFINAFQKTFDTIKNIELVANVWIIPEKNYDEIVVEMSQLPDIDNSWFDDKNTLNYFKFVMSTDGVKMAEYEINQLFQGGK